MSKKYLERQKCAACTKSLRTKKRYINAVQNVDLIVKINRIRLAPKEIQINDLVCNRCKFQAHEFHKKTIKQSENLKQILKSADTITKENRRDPSICGVVGYTNYARELHNDVALKSCIKYSDLAEITTKKYENENPSMSAQQFNESPVSKIRETFSFDQV